MAAKGKGARRGASKRYSAAQEFALREVHARRRREYIEEPEAWEEKKKAHDP